MKNFYSIGEAAKSANMTTETLRHYDRIGLVEPSYKDEWTGYRYYSKTDIILLNIIQMLRYMEIPLAEIKNAFMYNDLEKVVDFFKKAEDTADKRMAQLKQAKIRIQRARKDYECKLSLRQDITGTIIKEIPKRVILLSDTLYQPSVDNFWNYHVNFYSQLDEKVRSSFAFEDMAGIYTYNGLSKLFALCINHVDVPSLLTLPEGRYICSNCNEADKESVLENLKTCAKMEYGVETEFVVQLVVITGILQWKYEIQVYIKR